MPGSAPNELNALFQCIDLSSLPALAVREACRQGYLHCLGECSQVAFLFGCGAQPCPLGKHALSGDTHEGFERGLAASVLKGKS